MDGIPSSAPFSTRSALPAAVVAAPTLGEEHLDLEVPAAFPLPTGGVGQREGGDRMFHRPRRVAERRGVGAVLDQQPRGVLVGAGDQASAATVPSTRSPGSPVMFCVAKLTVTELPTACDSVTSKTIVRFAPPVPSLPGMKRSVSRRSAPATSMRWHWPASPRCRWAPGAIGDERGRPGAPATDRSGRALALPVLPLA